MATREHTSEMADGPMISVSPMARDGATDEARKQLLELQLRMVTCSINHEYARIELDDHGEFERREELLSYMHDCRIQYLEARSELVTYDPYALADFEADLMRQKQATLANSALN
jgi:hypothetical protein